MRIFILCLVLSGSLAAQSFNVSEFIQRTRTQYVKTDSVISNLYSYVMSRQFRLYAEKKISQFKQPYLKIDWSNPARINIEKTEFSIDDPGFIPARNRMIGLTTAFMNVWTEFFVNKHIPDSAANFNFNHTTDKVYFSYIIPTKDGFTRISKEFGRNGLLLKVNLQLPNKHTIEIKPLFQTTSSNKWLLNSWVYQRLDEQQRVLEGMDVTLTYVVIENQVYPENVALQIQRRNAADQVFVQTLQFYHYHLNDVRVY